MLGYTISLLTILGFASCNKTVVPDAFESNEHCNPVQKWNEYVVFMTGMLQETKAAYEDLQRIKQYAETAKKSLDLLTKSEIGDSSFVLRNLLTALNESCWRDVADDDLKNILDKTLKHMLKMDAQLELFAPLTDADMSDVAEIRNAYAAALKAVLKGVKWCLKKSEKLAKDKERDSKCPEGSIMRTGKGGHGKGSGKGMGWICPKRDKGSCSCQNAKKSWAKMQDQYNDYWNGWYGGCSNTNAKNRKKYKNRSYNNKMQEYRDLFCKGGKCSTGTGNKLGDEEARKAQKEFCKYQKKYNEWVKEYYAKFQQQNSKYEKKKKNKSGEKPVVGTTPSPVEMATEAW